MAENQRKLDRIRLLMQPEGELYLYVNGERYSVRSVLNISPQGISIQLDDSVGDASEVVVQYKHKDINLHVNGTVVWNMPAQEPPTEVELPSAEIVERSYDVGINLVGPHLLFSLMPTQYM